MDKLDPKTDGASADTTAENIEAIKALLPECVTEGKIDFDVLRELLGTEIEDRPERYSFNWNGKSRARRIAQTQSTGTLRPCPEESVNWDTTQNIFIEGDNLEVLKLLQKSYHKRVKLIYIDPPYNTGNEFIYPDKYQDNLETYLRYTGQIDENGLKLTPNAETSGRYHTNWLNMLYPRLKLARNLLHDDGSIWISIDDVELANLRQMCNEIFGEENFVAIFVWEKRKTRENRRVFSFNHDYVVCFARNKDAFESSRNLLPLTDEARARYSNPDGDYRGDWQSVALTAQAGHGTPTQFYTITTPSGRKIDPPSGNCWRVTKPKLDELITDNRIWFGPDGANVPRRKLFLSEQESGLTPHTLWKADEVGTTDSAKREFNSLFEGLSIFDTPKPVSLLQRICHIATEEGDMVLDFFAGSCPIAEAVLRENTAGRAPRRWILVQLPEPCSEESEAFKAGYMTIAEIGKERLRKSLERSAEDVGASSLGVRVFKLDASNLKPWDAAFDNLEPSLLDAVENIKPNRTELDILYELLLKYGLDLAVPVEEREIEGKKVYVVGAGALIVCLADGITLEVVEGIAALRAELQPEIMRVVFKDAGFPNDVVKTNTVQILRQAGIEDVKSL